MKIIAGKHKNRVIPTSKKADYRPSTTKFREALFSILSSGELADDQPIMGAKVLDLFSGAGSLSFEALSRGAASVTLVDNNSEHLKSALVFAEIIGEKDNVTTLNMNATNLSGSTYKYDLVFMDPPYYNGYVAKAVKSLQMRGWLKDGTIIAIEMSKRDEFQTPAGFRLVKEKIYGNNKLLILKNEQS